MDYTTSLVIKGYKADVEKPIQHRGQEETIVRI